MQELDNILNKISKNKKSFKKLQTKLNGVILGSQMYLIIDEIYLVDFIFEKFIKINGVWISDISINESDRVKKAIYDKDLKELMNQRIFEILIQLTDISKVLRSINQ